MIQGIYEELITQLVATKLNGLQRESYFVNKSKIDKEEASILLFTGGEMNSKLQLLMLN